MFSEDIDAVLDEIEEFVTGSRTGADPDRVLATLLFTHRGLDDTSGRDGRPPWRDLLD